MLLNDFYYIIQHESGDGTVKAVISFNKNHKIFDGHFPGQPVVPGVCMLQIVREILERDTSHSLKIISGDNIKFLSVINPEQYPSIEVYIRYTEDNRCYSVNATLLSGELTFFKFKGILQE